MEIRHDWARDEIHRIYHLPLPEHRAFHKPDEIQLLSGKPADQWVIFCRMVCKS